MIDLSVSTHLNDTGKPMMIHKNARPVVHTLSLPSPIKKYFSGETWEIDLSNTTNPYLDQSAEYPDIFQREIKELYVHTLLSIRPPSCVSAPPLALSHHNVLLTVGSMEGIDLLLRTFAEPNEDTICITDPTFPAYEHWGRLHNLKVTALPLEGEALDRFSVSRLKQINPRLLFLCNPNNPAGTKLDSSLITTLCRELDGFVIVDEAYIEFSNFSSSIFDIPFLENLIVLRTFSKAWGMAGVRCGAIIAHSDVIHSLRHVQLPFAVSSLTQEKVRKRLLNTQNTFDSWEKIKEERENFVQKLSACKNVSHIFKSEANFILVQFHDFPQAMTAFQQHKIHVMDCVAVIPRAVRITVGRGEQNKRVVEALGSLT